MGHLALPGSNTPMCIYTITNKVNSKVYVGQTTRLAGERWYKHAWLSEKGSAISAAIKKYGIEAFEFAVIDNAETVNQLNHKEHFWVYRLNSLSPTGYNLLHGGKNRIPSEETRRKMSEVRLGIPSKPEHVAKRAEALRAHWAANPRSKKAEPEKVDRQSPEFRKKCSEIKLGKRHLKRTINKNNKTSKSGVFFQKDHGSAGSYSAHAMVDGKMKSKRFGCLRRGKDEAFRLACEWRKQMELIEGRIVLGESA